MSNTASEKRGDLESDLSLEQGETNVHTTMRRYPTIWRVGGCSHSRPPPSCSSRFHSNVDEPKLDQQSNTQSTRGEAQYALEVSERNNHREMFVAVQQTLRQTWPWQVNDRAAICVRHVSVSEALQFAVFHAVSSVLHRNASQVIHCSELYVNLFFLLFWTE